MQNADDRKWFAIRIEYELIGFPHHPETDRQIRPTRPPHSHLLRLTHQKLAGIEEVGLQNVRSLWIVRGDSSATVTGLVPDSRYWFRIAATGSAGQSPWSSPVTARAV